MMSDMQGMYAPPREPNYASSGGAVLPGAAVTVFTANQVALATFLGTALAGGILIAINESRFGRKQAAWIAVVLSGLASAALLGIAFLLPDNFPAFPLSIAPVLVMRGIVHQRQRDLLSAHLGAGGKAASSWAAAGIGVACLVAVLIPVFAIAFVVALVKG